MNTFHLPIAFNLEDCNMKSRPKNISHILRLAHHEESIRVSSPVINLSGKYGVQGKSELIAAFSCIWGTSQRKN